MALRPDDCGRNCSLFICSWQHEAALEGDASNRYNEAGQFFMNGGV